MIHIRRTKMRGNWYWAAFARRTSLYPFAISHHLVTVLRAAAVRGTIRPATLANYPPLF